MNPTVVLIEIVIMLLVFGFCVFGLLYISPLTFISDYPPEIQAEYYRSQHKEAAKKKLTKLITEYQKHLQACLRCSCWSLCANPENGIGGGAVGTYGQDHSGNRRSARL